MADTTTKQLTRCCRIYQVSESTYDFEYRLGILGKTPGGSEFRSETLLVKRNTIESGSSRSATFVSTLMGCHSLEILSTTSENDVLSNDISEINNFIRTTREALIDNLEEQIVSAELNLQNIKLSLKEMKNERNKKTTEIDIKTKQHEHDITELDLNIKKQQEAIAVLENKSTQDEDKKNRIIQMTENQKKILSDLDTELGKVKNEIFDKQKQKLVIPKRNSNKKAKLEPLPNHSNWDSDSSIEGLDKTVYLKTLNKFRKQGARKNFPK